MVRSIKSFRGQISSETDKIYLDWEYIKYTRYWESRKINWAILQLTESLKRVELELEVKKSKNGSDWIFLVISYILEYSL